MSDATVLPQPGDTIAGQFLLDRVIGIGGTSIVFGARKRDSGERLAIKWLLPDDPTAQLASEAAESGALDPTSRVVGHFQHPNVVAARDIGRVTGSLYVLMDWVDGESLASRLARIGTMSVEEVVRLLIPCLRGMAAAHEAGIVHRDLKPANILISPGRSGEEVAKILDFEVNHRCKSVGDALALLGMPKARREALEYQAPEQRAGRAVDHRADVYAFGAIVYRMLSGRSPFMHSAVDRTVPALTFEDSDEESTAVQSGRQSMPMKVDVTMLPDEEPSARPLPTDVDAVVRRALASDPDERFQSMRELADALEACGERAAPEAPARSPAFELPSMPAPEPIRREANAEFVAGPFANNRVPFALTCLGLLVLCAVLVLRSRTQHDTTATATFEAVAEPRRAQLVAPKPTPPSEPRPIAPPELLLQPMPPQPMPRQPLAAEANEPALDALPTGASTPPSEWIERPAPPAARTIEPAAVVSRQAPPKPAAAPVKRVAAAPKPTPLRSTETATSAPAVDPDAVEMELF